MNWSYEVKIKMNSIQKNERSISIRSGYLGHHSYFGHKCLVGRTSQCGACHIQHAHNATHSFYGPFNFVCFTTSECFQLVLYDFLSQK